MKSKLLFIPAVLLTLPAGMCKTAAPPEPIVKTVYVNVPVSAPCVPKTLAGPPTYVDTDEALKAAKDAAERYQLVYAGRIQRVARLGEVEPVVASCPKEK